MNPKPTINHLTKNQKKKKKEIFTFVGRVIETAMVDQSPRRVAVAALLLLVVISDLSNSAGAANSVSAFVQNAILSNKIVIFSKSYCP